MLPAEEGASSAVLLLHAFTSAPIFHRLIAQGSILASLLRHTAHVIPGHSTSPHVSGSFAMTEYPNATPANVATAYPNTPVS
jgi:hypothetical protein